MDSLLSLALAGALIGLIVGITGVGGGSLMTPTLINWFGVPPITAVATDLGFAAITKSAGVLAHRRSNQVRWPVARLMVICSCSSAIVTLCWMNSTTVSSSSITVLIRQTLAAALLLTVLALIFQRRLTQWRARFAPLDRRLRWSLTVLASAAIGVLVAVSSIGAGAIGVTVLTLLYPEWQPREVAATDLAYAVPLTAVSASLHALHGHVDAGLMLGLLLGSVPAIVLGVRLGAYLNARTVRALLAGCLSLAAAKLVI